MPHKQDALEPAIGSKFRHGPLRIHAARRPRNLGDVSLTKNLGDDCGSFTGTDDRTGKDQIGPQALLLHEASDTTRLLRPLLRQSAGEIISAMRLRFGMAQEVEKHWEKYEVRMMKDENNQESKEWFPPFHPSSFIIHLFSHIAIPPSTARTWPVM